VRKKDPEWKNSGRGREAARMTPLQKGLKNKIRERKTMGGSMKILIQHSKGTQGKSPYGNRVGRTPLGGGGGKQQLVNLTKTGKEKKKHATRKEGNQKGEDEFFRGQKYVGMEKVIRT